MREKITNTASYFIHIVSGLILFYLFLISLFSTCYVTDTEYVFFVGDHWFLNFLFLLAVLAGVCFAPRLKTDQKKSGRILLILFACLLISILAALPQKPIYDQNKVVQIASDLCRSNYREFLRGGYAQECTNQHGYILFLAFLFRIFGVGNVLVVEIINVISIFCSVICLVKISKYLFRGENIFWILPAAVLFLPLWGYVTFIYANMLSFCLALAALLCECEYLYAEGKWPRMLMSGILISVSVILKTNSVIILIAMVLILIMQSIEEKDLKKTGAAVWILLSFFLCTKVEQACISGITGTDDFLGIPRTAHIAMGLQESSTRAAGWYNGFPMKIYEECSFDYDDTQKRAAEDILGSLDNFRAHPTYAAGFFVRKIASQWNEPTFESLFIQMNRSSDAELPSWAAKMIKNEIGSPFVLEVFNMGHVVILFGTFLFICLDFRNQDFRKNAFLIIFIGGFLFHLFWEANSQYVVGYFFLLIPYSVRGFLLARRNVSRHRNGKEFLHSPVPKILCVLAAVVLFLGVQRNNVLAQAVKTDSGTEEFRECMAVKDVRQEFADGRYFVRTAAEPEWLLDISANEREEGSRLCVREQNGDEQRVILAAGEGDYTLRFQKSQLVADVPEASEKPGTRVWQWSYNGDISQRFRIRQETEECVSFLYRDTFALTYDVNTGNVTIEEYTGAENQLWRLQKQS